MKKIFETPEVRVITLAPNDVIATSGVSRGTDIEEGEEISCDAPGRHSVWD